MVRDLRRATKSCSAHARNTSKSGTAHAFPCDCAVYSSFAAGAMCGCTPRVRGAAFGCISCVQYRLLSFYWLAFIYPYKLTAWTGFMRHWTFFLFQLRGSNFTHVSSAVRIYDFHIFIFIYFTIIGYITNSQLTIYPCGLVAQWIEHCTGIARSWVQIPFKPEFFFRLLFQLLKLKAHCEDQISLIPKQLPVILMRSMAIKLLNFTRSA